MNCRFTSLLFLLLAALPAWACTNLIVGKNASVDGSVMVSYSADSFGSYGHLYHSPAATYAVGSLVEIYDWETGAFRGRIKQVPQTYSVIGNINEFQVTIAETTFGGRSSLVNERGIIDYGSLMYIALQRSTSAREAITVMANLVQEYGYGSEGESFTVADPNEVWIMEMIGKGPNVVGAVWVAVRIPDDCIAAHANQARIRQFSMDDPDNCLYAPDVISFAREQGFFEGKNSDFSFADTYCPLDFSALRQCEARVWSFFRRHNAAARRYLSFITGESSEPMPLYIKPDRKVSLQELKDDMRDHYEGTVLDMSTDLASGPYHSPYRPSPLRYTVDGIRYFHERPIGTQQAMFSFVSQMRNFLPNAIGGVLWFALDDSNMVAYTPIYCASTAVPPCYAKTVGSDTRFSWDSAFWVCNWVSNMIYPRYSLMIDDLRRVQQSLEVTYLARQAEIEAQALALCEEAAEEIVPLLTRYSVERAEEMLATWKELGEYLIVKYNDMVVKQTNDDGSFKLTPEGICPAVLRPGYPEDYTRKVAEQTGNRYLLP